MARLLAATLVGLALGAGGCYPTFEFDLPDTAGAGSAGSTISSASAGGAGGAGGSCGTFALPGTSALKDDFNDGTPGQKWITWDAACGYESNGDLNFTPAANTAPSYCAYATIDHYHLTCDSVTVRVPQVTSQTVNGPQTFIYIVPADGSDNLNLLLEDGHFSLSRDSDTIKTGGPYDPAQDVWWRLRESGGDLLLETSPDGEAWTERGRGPDPMPLDEVQIDIGAGTWMPVADPGRAKFDCYNLAGSCP